MFGGYEERLALEDDLYGESEEAGGSEVDNSELEFRLYSQLHYSSNPGDGGEEEEEEEIKEQGEKTCREKGGMVGEELQMSEATQRRTPSHDPHGQDLRQQLVGHSEQKNKKSKKVRRKRQLNVKESRVLPKDDPKVQRLFQEVIVIDLGSDEVITVSDNTEEDEGVCHMKGRKLKTGPPKSSTPVLQRNSAEASGRDFSVDSVVVLDSDSVSESESDSDGLESWMILGSGRQDGDQSISLNLEGSGGMEDGDTEESWLISDKDKEAQIINRRFASPSTRGRVPNRYYTDKNVTCHSCKKTGHLSKNCPTPKKDPCCMLCGEPGHRMQRCPSRPCYRCGLPGHEYEACHSPNLRFKQCLRCGMHGHLGNTCPEIWRQYHITTKSGPLVMLPVNDAAASYFPFCYNCSHRGHFGFDCSQRRMFAGITPCSPFINHYDSPLDLRRVEVRTQLRVKELKDSHVFQSQLSPQGGFRDEPPGKRQRPNPSPSSKRKHSNMPNRTHIRFTDGQEKPWTPKHKLKESGEEGSVTPAKHSPSENRQSQGQKKQKKTKKQKQVQNKMASVSTALDDCQAFPRGGAPRKKKGRRKSSAGAPPPSYPPERLLGAEKKKRPNGRERKAKMASEDMYPSDENLFLIKQRKPRR